MRSDLRSIKGVIFDLWNTLAFSSCEPNPMEMLAEALGIRHRVGWRKILERGMMTRPFLGIREALSALERESGAAISPPFRREELVRSWNQAAISTKLFPDAIPALDLLKPRLKIGLLSNTQSFDIEFVRSGPLASRLDAACLSCNEGMLKPDPALFRRAAGALALRPDETVMVGDSLKDDVAGALAAGLHAVHLDRTGAGGVLPRFTGRVESLNGLSSLLS